MIIFKYIEKYIKMNAYLQKLFEKHKVSEKDKHEILQIYTFLLPMD